jgi:UDP-glucose 4-epimerase
MEKNIKDLSILVTGASGFIGSETIRALAKDFKLKHVVGLDVRERPDYLNDLDMEYIKGDIRDPKIADIMKEFEVDVVVHLAAVMPSGKETTRDFEYSVDVLGTKNILECSLKAGVDKIIVTSSGAAYGYHWDNPEWLSETDELRGNKEFAYSDHKRIVEEMLAKYREKHPELKQLIFRPGAVLGRTVSNQITDLFKKPVIMGVMGTSTPFTFIWDQDVVACIKEGIVTGKTGIYNLAGDGKVTMKQIAKIMNKPYLPIPSKIMEGALSGLNKLKLTQYGPEQLIFIKHRPVLANDNLKEKFEYTPRKTSLETFEYYLQNRIR